MPLNGTPIDLGFLSTMGLPVEATYLYNGVAWVSTAEALTNIPAGSRYPYMIINVAGELYWFSADVTSLSSLKDSLLQDASEVPTDDVGGFFVSENVEDTLQEIGQTLEERENYFPIELSASAEVSGRIAGSVVPDGWTIAVGPSAVDLDIFHGLTRRVVDVHVYAVDVSGEHQRLLTAQAWSGLISLDDDNIRIQNLGRINKPLILYIQLA